ncbi:MAG TPA: class I adenylate-forming enzyme family protein [Pseudonocardia sp.]
MELTAPNQVSGWGNEVVVEEVLGRPCRVFAERPGHLRELVALGARYGDRTHLIQGGQRLSFGELARSVDRVAEVLRAAGARPGDRVMLAGANSLAWVVTFWTCLCNDWVLIPANAWWSAEEVEYAARLVDARLAVVDARRRDRMPPGMTCVELAALPLDATGPATGAGAGAGAGTEDDPAMVLFTSGTTSFPRGAVLSHRGLLANLQNLLAIARRLPGPDESTRPPGITLMTMPLFHIGGIQQLFTALVSGGTLVFLDGRFSARQVLGLIETERITGWAAVPTMLSRVLDLLESDPSGYDVTTLRTMVIGGSPVAESLRARARVVFPSTRRGLGASYGLTEISGVAATEAGPAVAERPGTVGRPLPTVEVRIEAPDRTGVGEVLLRTPGAMIGYWGAPEDPVFTPDRWLRTGDLGRLDDEGYLYIEGRVKDVVIRGGENIATARVEDRLLAHPEVAEVAVVGLPHPELGEELGAVVVRHPGAAVDPAGLAAFAAGTLAYFAVPTRWWFLDELPKNATGKVLKRQLVESWPLVRN